MSGRAAQTGGLPDGRRPQRTGRHIATIEFFNTGLEDRVSAVRVVSKREGCKLDIAWPKLSIGAIPKYESSNVCLGRQWRRVGAGRAFGSNQCRNHRFRRTWAIPDAALCEGRDRPTNCRVRRLRAESRGGSLGGEGQG